MPGSTVIVTTPKRNTVCVSTPTTTMRSKILPPALRSYSTRRRALHRHLPSHAPNPRGCPSEPKHQGGLVLASPPGTSGCCLCECRLGVSYPFRLLVSASYSHVFASMMQAANHWMSLSLGPISFSTSLVRTAGGTTVVVPATVVVVVVQTTPSATRRPTESRRN